MSNPHCLEMLQTQLIPRGIHDPAVLKAMSSVPRENFVSPGYEQYAYDDCPLPIEENQTISQPYIVALMLQLLSLKPSDTLLDIGAGSGYAAAIASRIVSRVYAIELYPKLTQQASTRFTELKYNNIEIKTGDGYLGWPEHAPYDAIQIAAACSLSDLAKLQQQLKIGGRMVIPSQIEGNHFQELILIERISNQEYRQKQCEIVRFVPLVHPKELV